MSDTTPPRRGRHPIGSRPMTSAERQARRRRQMAEVAQRLKAAQLLLDDLNQMLEKMDGAVRHRLPDEMPTRDELFDIKEALESLSARMNRLLIL